jgi:putative CocE/NonD family hydrolase
VTEDHLDGDEPPAVRGSLEQVMVTEVVPGATVTLYGPDGGQVDQAQARFPEEPLEWFEFASYVFRGVEPGEGYQVTQTVNGTESPRSDPIEVLPGDYIPPQSFYDQQTLDEGFGYFEARDGTQIAHQVVFPAEEVADPPYPVLTIYSGYAPSVDLPGNDVIIDRLANELGYAIVGVNKRGTQCSGGKFDFFERLQQLDGYDMIEVIATQEWSDGIGLAGASYSGYSQFYVAATQPPSLDAIAPGMPVGDFYRDTGRPGGILNNTFAAAWASSRDESARHDNAGRGDSLERIDNGDQNCLENQYLRPNNRPTAGRLRNELFVTDFYRDRAPWNLVDQVEVPVLLVTSWQDEQVGSRATRLHERFPDDILVRYAGGNGDHGFYLTSAVVDDLEEFFAYYVKEETPDGEDRTYDEALAAYESEDPIRIYWEVDQDGSPRYNTSYGEWPPTDVETWELYLRQDGRLAESPPETDEIPFSSYEFVAKSFILQQIARDDQDRLQWEQRSAEESVAFVSEELDEDHVCLGSGLVELWLRSTAEDTDLQVTLSEVRPDGTETYVQNGWLRASHRAENEDRARPRRPWQTHLEADAEPLPDEFTRMRVELFPFGHAFRAGSRVKIAVDNPGGTRNLWGFRVTEAEATNEVAHTSAMPSKLELPLVAGERAQTDERPACGTVRNQPCRPVDVDALLDSAAFTIERLGSESLTASPDEPVTVTADVSNAGGTEGTARVELRADGAVLETQEHTVGAGETATATFADLDLTAELDPGEYEPVVWINNDRRSLALTVTGGGGDGSGNETDSNETDGNETDGGDGSGPGFGVGTALASLGGAGYLLKQRLGGDDSSE